MLSVFRAIVNEINGNSYIYKTDRQLYGKEEHWSELKEVDGKLVGDCEDYCITIANRALEQGVPRDKLKLHLVQIGKEPDHIVLEYDGWFADCNTKGITRRIPYKKISFRRLDRAYWERS